LLALDPWSLRAFWVELATVALKAAILIAAFAALPMTAVMLFRNQPLSALETLGLYASYAAAWLVIAFGFVVVVALVLKVRPALPIDTPQALLAISLIAGALLVAPVAVWWYQFDTAAPLGELATGIALCAVFFSSARSSCPPRCCRSRFTKSGASPRFTPNRAACRWPSPRSC
jgi:hypothetical protein